MMTAAAPDLGGGQVEFVVPPGATLDRIARDLEARGLVAGRTSFKWTARLVGAEKRFKAGYYLLPRGARNLDLVRYLLRPGVRTLNVTIPEGLNLRQVAGIFRRELGLDSAEFVRLCRDSDFASELGVKAGGLEGYLFPDTYNFYQSDRAREVIRRMVGRFREVAAEAVTGRLASVNLTLHQAVTLASIIQGEVVDMEEARLVSAVYHNRLRRRMPLEADPTIQYIIPDGPRRLLAKDLETDSPYNTYRRAGLPPGPINNPGRAALEAAVNPAPVNYLFFVAVGDGRHAFSADYETFLRDKARFQRVRRQAAQRAKG